MQSVSLFAPQGPGNTGRPVSLPDIPQIAERRVDHLEKRLEAGKLDTETLDKRLQAQFGEAAKGIVGKDGSVDFDRLEKLIIETRSAKLQDRITARFGEEGAGTIGTDGSIDKGRLRELFSEDRIERIFDRLEKRFGDAVAGVRRPDGSIDFEALKKLIANAHEVEPVKPRVAEKIEPVAVPPVVKVEEPGDGKRPIETDKTAEPGNRARDQLTELRKILFHEQPESRFGDAVDRVFKVDGGIDFEALRQLFEGKGPDRPERPGGERGQYFRSAILERPLFDLRA